MKIHKINFILFALLFSLTITTKTQGQETQQIPELRHEPYIKYGRANCLLELSTLDDYAEAIRNALNSTGYVIIYGGSIGKKNEALARLAKIKAYLAQKRGIEPSRVITVDAGYDKEFITELWIIPNGAEPPETKPAIAEKDVTFNGESKIIDELRSKENYKDDIALPDNDEPICVLPPEPYNIVEEFYKVRILKGYLDMFAVAL